VRFLATLIVFLACAAPASASVGPCVPGGPSCTFWTGNVTFVADGDTIDVDIAGDGTARPRRVRLTGFNAMEQTRYSHTASRRRGACHALEATARLEQLLRRGRMRVRLAAQDRASVTGGRLRRQVSARLHGRWTDVGRTMVAEGHALWLPNGTEWVWNGHYADLSRQAAAAGLNLWDPMCCGAGPASDAAVVPAGGSLTLRMGRGADTAETFHWGLSTPPFENPSYDERATGDGGYLFDPRGNLRAWSIYN
jgi:micrococcal nuclease